MIGLDTNVIVRYIAQDDAVQSAKATKLIESLSPETPGFIALIAVAEFVWVARSCYRASDEAIANMIETLLRTKDLIIERAELVWQALRHFQSSPGANFADYLIERCGHAEGCKYTATFDRSAAKAAGMKNIG